MLAKLRELLQRHHRAVREAEALVYHQRATGVAVAKKAAEDPGLDEESRRYWSLVARIAEQRLAELRIPDVATAYYIQEQWARRRGQMIR
jgi:hypothetical protein